MGKDSPKQIWRKVTVSAAKANNNKDTYKATAITLIVFGVLYLADKLLHFSTLGLSWDVPV